MKVFSSILCLLAVFIVVVVSLSSSSFLVTAGQNTNNNGVISFQHSLDGGKTWITRGTIDANNNMEFQPSAENAKWSKDQLQQLRNLAQKKGIASVAESSVLVRVVQQQQQNENAVAVLASTAVSPCALVVPRQYTSQLTYIAERYGITTSSSTSITENNNNNNDDSASTTTTITSLRLLNPFHDEVCEPTVFKTKDNNNEDGGVKLKISFVKAPVMKNLAFPHQGAGGEDRANLHSGAINSNSNNNRRGATSGDEDQQQQQAPAAAPAQEQTFWEKYGTYIIIFLVVQTVSGFFAPKEQAGGAAGKGGKGGAAPAK